MLRRTPDTRDSPGSHIETALAADSVACLPFLFACQASRRSSTIDDRCDRELATTGVSPDQHERFINESNLILRLADAGGVSVGRPDRGRGLCQLDDFRTRQG